MVSPFSTAWKCAVLAFLLIDLAGCASSGRSGKRVIEARGGHAVPGYGFSVDAHYESDLDRLVPPYKLLTIAIRNTSLSVIEMDPRKDRWTLVGEKGKKIQAINQLRDRDRDRWERLPDEVKRLVEYPQAVPISYTVTSNLFFPSSARLERFSEIRYYNAASGDLLKVFKEE